MKFNQVFDPEDNNRQERESCLNNINLNLSLTSGFPKEKSRQSDKQRRQLDRTYSKKSREKFLQGSLENVSSNPFGEFDTHQSTLRRSRSLAISREAIFTSLDIPSANRQRRPQLIPRAKLIDRSSLKDRCVPRDRNQEISQTNDRQIIKRKSSFSSDYAVPQVNLLNTPKSYQSSVTAIRRASEENAPFAQINTFSTPNGPDIDSLDSNSYNKSSLHGISRVSHDNFDHSTDYGLSLPNYYPDSRCETDISLTDVSLADNISIKEEPQHEGRKRDKKTPPRDNLSKNNLFYEESSSPNDSCDNIIYHDNISFGRSVLDEKYAKNTKPRTIRQYTPFHHENFYEGKPRSLPNYTLSCPDESNYEGNIYDVVEKPEEKLKIYEELAEISGEPKLDSDFSQSDLNFDEINLNNANITKIVEAKKIAPSSDSCFENNPIYDEIPCYAVNPGSSNSSSSTAGSYETDETLKIEVEVTTTEKLPEQRPPEQEPYKIIHPAQKDVLKTRVQVHADEGIYSLVRKTEDQDEEYKTIVNVEETKKEEPIKEGRRHSHNYLKEFLESQKGSRKPLQNFLSKKISRAFGETKKIPETSNLVTSQYHSLPDLSIGKNLRQCEKIDRKLRKCEKVPNLAKPTPTTTTNNNRFIVNIGRHFDVTAESNIPVDFEVKISKIPKLRKSKKNSKENKQQVFIDAVKNLNDTLNGLTILDENQNGCKPQVVEVKAKTEIKPKNSGTKRLIPTKYKKHKESQRSEDKTEKVKLKPLPKINEGVETKEVEMDPKASKEFQEKLDLMRNYWGKMTQSDTVEDENDENEAPKCKIVDVKTKVEDVIRKFEPKEEKDVEKQESIVQATKQIFEPRLSPEKPEKLSQFVRESCEFFENPYFEKYRIYNNSNQFESLNPNIVEIIEKEENGTDTIDNKLRFDQKRVISNLPILSKQHKPVAKSSSNKIEPEFDHVRYRVMKSDLFQKNIFANCQKESQFDGLMQYLQDYSFQELLIDNNIVIIEPIRSNVPHEGAPGAKTSRNITKLLHKSHNPLGQNTGSRRRFFYHPVRVNKEMNEDELPNPDTVKQVRQFFEGGLKKSRSSQELDTLTKKTVQYQTMDPDKDNCSATDSNSNPSNPSEIGSNDNLYDNELCCEQQYVSEDILQKIRECGTSVTYYGGKVLNKRNCNKSNPMTRTIMAEIRGDQVRECTCTKEDFPVLRRNSLNDNDNRETYHGIKFKLLKSNSCSSRLELVGTQNLSEYRQKFFEKQKYLIDQKNRENQRKNSIISEKDENFIETTTIELKTKDEENIKDYSEKEENNAPKIISATGKGKILTQWGSASEEKTYNNINFNKSNQKVNYDYKNYEKVKMRTKKIDDMEFEPYEIA